MTRKTDAEINQELARIESLIRSHPEGISLRDILEEFSMRTQSTVSERTMLRLA
jgi:hypothetical protein